jgi:hypothetical protein
MTGKEDKMIINHKSEGSYRKTSFDVGFPLSTSCIKAPFATRNITQKFGLVEKRCWDVGTSSKRVREEKRKRKKN